MTKAQATKKKVFATTHDELMASMTAEQKKEYDKGYREFLLSELLLAIMKDDAISVRELAKAAGISPAVIQGIRSGEKQNITIQSFFSILRVFDCSLVVKRGRRSFPIELAQA